MDDIPSTAHPDSPPDGVVLGVIGAPLRPLDPAWPRADRIGWWIFDGIYFVPSAVAVVALLLKDGGEMWAKLIVTGIWCLIMAVLLWATLAYPTAAFRRAAIAVGDLGVEFRRGVFWRKATIIPRSRVQHTDVSQGPLMRRFGLGKLVIHTAGTRNAVVTINGLALAEAERIRDLLLERARDTGSEGGGEGAAESPGGQREGDGV